MEEWRKIEGYEDLYEVSNHGRVKSLGNDKTRKEKILKGGINIHGYHYITLSKNKKLKNYLVHRLVVLHFINNDDNKPEVNHIDGNKKNNHISNLEWNTRSENMLHAVDTGLRNIKGEKNGNSKLSEEQVLEIRNSNLTQRELGKKYNVGKTIIYYIKNNI